MLHLAQIYSAQAVGLRAHTITIEVDIFRGFHSFSVVGLPDKAVEESRDRVSSSIKSIGFEPPKTRARGQQKVVVALAPADIKKEGPLFDVPIALGYLLAAGDIAFDTQGKLFLGELSLSGKLRAIKGTLVLAKHARDAGFTELFLPAANVAEAALIDGIEIYGVETLAELVGHLNTKPLDPEKHNDAIPILKSIANITPAPRTPFRHRPVRHAIDFSDVRGQDDAKRGLEIAAAGGHNVAFYGPPGTGKTLLAKAFASILPPLSFEEALEVTGIHSISGKLDTALISLPPFRAPHHTSSHVAIIGGGAIPAPGEITLAHRGVLFLDEFPEFEKRVIEALRQPLEDGTVSIARARGAEVFPAEFILIAALNPCPCGFKGDTRKTCTCTQSQILKYGRKISGPIMDRIDMWIEVPRSDIEILSKKPSAEERKQKTSEMRGRIAQARGAQQVRFADAGNTLNSTMNIKMLERHVPLSPAAQKQLNDAARSLDLSARGYHRIIKLARTIADLESADDVHERHILEAVRYRPKQSVFG